ncbi:MAG: transposase [Clostridia bacterium]|nr:transposase [Clostridia bacterium]
MSRIARIKPISAIFHVMCRSMSELLLFRDEDDKNYYLGLLKKYCDKFQCSVYGYCLMNNHLHLHFDPKGFDLSRFMLCLNTAYVVYYNRKYGRHGHLFQGRFESKVISSDTYNLAVSAYIHNNPQDIEGYRGREYEYPFSSMGIYMGARKDLYKLVDTTFILGIFNVGKSKKAVQRYVEFVAKRKDGLTSKEMKNCLYRVVTNEYKNERKIIFRETKPQSVLDAVSRRYGLPNRDILGIKYNRQISELRAASAFLLRALCNFSYRDICQIIGNMTLSGISRLCTKGFELYKRDKDLRKLFNQLVLSI